MIASASGLYRPLVWSVAVLLVASGVLLTIQMIRTVVGPFRLAEIGAHDPRAVVALWKPLGLPSGISVRSPFGEELVASGRAVRETATLDGLDAGRTGAIVLSEPRRLEARDLAALDAFLADGGGVVLLGSVAVLDREGGWRGYAAMERVLGARVIPLEERDASGFVAARRGPISGALAPRERVLVAFEPGTLAVAAEEPELRWEGAGAHGHAAAIRRTAGAGRLAWLAVSPERALPDEAARRRARGVLEAAVAWASRTPAVEILPWPKGAAFAGVVEAGEPGADPERAWRAAIDAARRDGGVAELRMPAGPPAHAALQPVLERVLARADREKGWVATRAEIAEWTRARAVVKASVRRTGPRRVTVEVSNRSRADVEGVVLRVHLNDAVLGARAEATQLLQASASLRLLPDGETLDLAVPRLAARSSTAYHVDLEAAPGGVAQRGDG